MGEYDLRGIDTITNISNVLNITEDNGKLTFTDGFSPHVIDSNFNELERRIESLESNVQKLTLTVEKLTNKINVLNALMKI